MLNNEFLQDLSSRIARLVPMAAGVREQVEKNVHETLQGAFAHLNLVTREEFEAQLKVLARAQQTIAALEEKIVVLEQTQHISHSGESADQ